MNFFSIIGNSDATKLARVIERSLIALNYELPTNEQLFKIVTWGRSISDAAHHINKHYVNLLKEALLSKFKNHKSVIERLLSVQYLRSEGNPSKDYCYVYFLHNMLENPSETEMTAFCNYLDYYLLNLHLGGFNGHTTFSVTLPQDAFDKLKEEKLDRYICPLTFPSGGKNSQLVTNGYLLDVGLMRQHDSETKNHFGYVQRAFDVIEDYNRFILHAEDFLPDYLIINLTEE